MSQDVISLFFYNSAGDIVIGKYLVVVERLVGIDWNQDCGKAKRVVVHQEESNNGEVDFSSFTIQIFERKVNYLEPGVVDINMV